MPKKPRWRFLEQLKWNSNWLHLRKYVDKNVWILYNLGQFMIHKLAINSSLKMLSFDYVYFCYIVLLIKSSSFWYMYFFFAYIFNVVFFPPLRNLLQSRLDITWRRRLNVCQTNQRNPSSHNSLIHQKKRLTSPISC